MIFEEKLSIIPQLCCLFFISINAVGICVCCPGKPSKAVEGLCEGVEPNARESMAMAYNLEGLYQVCLWWIGFSERRI